MRLTPYITLNIMGPFSLAVDWITDKLYVAQKALGRIDVFVLQSQQAINRTALITTNLFSPTSLVIDTNSSYLFFADSGNSNNRVQGPKIERASLDGSIRKVIVKDKLLAPVAITLDLIKKRIFWADRKYDHVETCDYFGSRRYIVASGSRNLPHVVSADLFESTLFLADQTKMAIIKLTRHAISTEANITNHYKVNELN